MTSQGAPGGGSAGAGRAEGRSETGEGADGAMPPCCVCGTTRGRRRRKGACTTCSKKFAAAELDIPGSTPTPPGPRPRDPLLSLLDRCTREQRLRVRRYLHEQMAEEET